MSYQIWEAGEVGPGASSVADSGASVTALFREHHAELVRLAVLMTGDRASAEDIVQDVFARLCAQDRLPDSRGAVAYVRAAVLNGCRSALQLSQDDAGQHWMLNGGVCTSRCPKGGFNGWLRGGHLVPLAPVNGQEGDQAW
jgi:hypothetical protein